MSLPIYASVIRELETYASKEKAVALARFFKTGKGQYGEGDEFLGIVVPNIRQVAKQFYKEALLDEVGALLRSPYHEVRLCALIMLVYKYQRAESLEVRAEIYDLYLSNTKYINNWDLIDLTAPHIVGMHLLQYSKKPMGILNKLAISSSLWERRIAMLATFAFIRAGKHEEAFAIAQILLRDKHDLIHKAVGWMLREVGKRVGPDTLRVFLDEHASQMPRTALRYAIEHLDEKERRYYIESSRT